jgi:O-antigen/teichoic acid export membrane protein
MGIVLRQSAWNTGILFIGIGIGFVNEVLLLRNFLEAEQVGLAKILAQASILMAQISTLGGSSIILRYFPRFRELNEKQGGILFGTACIVLLGFVLVCTTLGLIWEPLLDSYRDKSPIIGEYAFLLFPMFFCGAYFFLLEAYSRSLLKTIAPNVFREIFNRVGISILVLVFASGWISAHQFFLLFAVVYCLQFFLLAFWMGLHKQLKWRPDWSFFKKDNIKEIFSFGLFTIAVILAASMFTTIDSLMVGAYIDAETVAVYMLGVYLTSVLMAPGRSLLRISAPIVAEHWENNDLVEMNKLYRQVSDNGIAASGMLFLCILAGSELLFSLMREADLYRPALEIFTVLAIGRLFDVGTLLNRTILTTSRKYRLNLLFTGSSAILAILLNVWAIPKYGAIGAAWATALSFLFMNGSSILYIWIRFKLWPFSWRSMGLVAAGAFTLACIHFLPLWGENGILFWADHLLRVALVALVFGFFIIRFRLSEEMTDLFFKLSKKYLGLGPGSTK